MSHSESFKSSFENFCWRCFELCHSVFVVYSDAFWLFYMHACFRKLLVYFTCLHPNVQT